MKPHVYISIAYACLLAIGGLIGYMTKGSLASISMGTLSALLVGLTAWGMHSGSALAHTLGIVLALLLLCFFGYRYTTTGAFMPSGLMALCSLLVAALLATGHKWLK